MKKLKMLGLYFLIAIGLCLGLGYFLHLVVFPEKIPDISSYFKPGDVFESEMEGFSQTVVRQEDGMVYCKLELAPHAPGPPMHIHTSFDELFENGDQQVSMVVDGEDKILQPGERILIKKGTPHKPHNPTDNTVHLEMNEFAFPEEFAFYLNQVYGYLDESESNMKPPKVLFQMAMFGQNFDSYLAEKAPPVAVQKFTNFMIVPLARLLGYRSYYPKYDIKR